MSDLSELIDLRVERLPAVIAATWRDFHPLAALEAASPAEAVAGGPFEQGDVA